MADPAPAHPVVPPRFTVERYLALVDDGVLAAEDRVELLEGVVVAMAPRSVRHDAGVTRCAEALREAIGRHAVVRVQCALVVAPHSVPEPDVAVVPGPIERYDTAHPTSALLVVEVADSSLQQDRLTKTAIYATAGVPEYWILDLRDDSVAVFRAPDPATATYRDTATVRPPAWLTLAAIPGVAVDVGRLIPAR